MNNNNKKEHEKWRMKRGKRVWLNSNDVVSRDVYLSKGFHTPTKHDTKKKEQKKNC